MVISQDRSSNMSLPHHSVQHDMFKIYSKSYPKSPFTQNNVFRILAPFEEALEGSVRLASVACSALITACEGSLAWWERSLQLLQLHHHFSNLAP